MLKEKAPASSGAFCCVASPQCSPIDINENLWAGIVLPSTPIIKIFISDETNCLASSINALIIN
jgi:hypothetical protein